MDDPPLKLEDVSKMTLEKCAEYLEKEEIEYEHLVTLEEMQARIKQYLEEKRGQSNNTEGPFNEEFTRNEAEKSAPELMAEILSEDKKMKDDLSEIYVSLIKFVKCETDDEIKSVLEEIYGVIDELLVKQKGELTSNECPIVVAGETSAGKSSLLNLILGTDVLPHSLLCATSTICCLRNSEYKRFEIIPEGSDEPVDSIVISEGSDADEELKEKLKPYVSSMEGREEKTYKQVDIYWPIPMLQDRVTIVDTPGVGESEKMTEKLMEYLPNAVAFIYVINSANSGGIQEDRLISILNKQKKWEQEGKLTSLDYTSTMFVCNKWDIVEKRQEEERVWKDTLDKLTDILPKFPKEQVFKMSAAEADRFRRSGMGKTLKFKQLLEGVQTLVPRSLRAKMGRHFKFLDKFLMESVSKVSSRINHAKKTQEDRKKLYDEVLNRLTKLNMDADRVREGLVNTARAECQMMVQRLHEHLHSKAVVERLLAWREDDAPDIEAEDFEVTKYKGDRTIASRIMKVLKEWEEENKLIQEASERLTRMFKEECRILGENCTSVNLIVEGLQDEDLGSALGFVHPSNRGNDELFTKSEKIILAVAAPLWVPLVTAASLLFLPVGVGMFVRETIRAAKQRKDYTENKVKYMQEWTQKIIDTAFTEDNIGKFIFETYFGHFEKKINELCSDFIPKQIAADQRQVNLIANDARTSHQILEQYQPMLYRLQEIKGQLQLFELDHMSKDLIDFTEIHTEKEIGHGNFSDVYLATWRNNRDEKRVALKVLRRKMKGSDMLHQLEEVDILRKIKHPNVVELYGLCYKREKERTQNSQLTLVMELCEDSLESMVFNNDKLQCRLYKSVPERCEAFRFYVKMATGICLGLAEMHKRGYLHRDLKLSNVLIKNDIAKLCDLGFARKELAMTGTFVGTMTHMSPEILKHDQYTYSTDIYSLGILMWEFWYGRLVYSEPEYKGLSAFELLEAVIIGTRPAFKGKFGPTVELKELIEDCWHADPKKRPEASEVADKLNKMFLNYYGESLVINQRSA